MSDATVQQGPAPGGAVEEIELKLRLDPADVGRFRRSPLLRDHKIARAGGSHLISTYFDTPSLALRQRKIALRLRQAGRSVEQTLKVPKGAVGGLQTRSEWNAFLQGTEPDLSLIGDPAQQKWLIKRQESEGLEPVFVTDIHRTTWQIVYGQTRMEVALDQGEIRSGDRTRAISEVELELQSGSADDLLAFALELTRVFRLVLDRDSKAARGYALFLDTVPEAVRAKEPTLTAALPVPAAFAAFIRSGIEQTMANVPVVLAGEDIEGVHQARVGVRRMRSALSQFKSVLDPEILARAKADLSWLQSALGPARDLDVFIDETLMPLTARFPDDGVVASVSDAATEARRQAYEQASAALQSSRYSETLIRLEGWLLTLERAEYAGPSLKEFAARSLDKRLKRVMKDAGKRPSRLAEEVLHPLRIDIKKLRYAAAFFRSLYGEKQTKPYIQRLGRLQDCLGGLNDALVQRSVLDSLNVGKGRVRDRMQGILDGWHAARIEQGLASLDLAWSELRELKPFWR